MELTEIIKWAIISFFQLYRNVVGMKKISYFQLLSICIFLALRVGKQCIFSV